jgi:hypothetical protein
MLPGVIVSESPVLAARVSCEGQRLDQQRAGRAQPFREAGRGSHAVEADQGGDEDPDAGEHVEPERDRLREEEVGEHEEEAEIDAEHHFALRLHLQQLQRRHDDEERDARLAPEEAPVLGEGRHARGDREGRGHPARREVHRRPGDPRAPREHHQEEDAHPVRQAQQVRRHDEHHRREQPEDVAHVQVRRARDGTHVWNSASASRQRARCRSPRAGAMTVPGMRSP